MSTGIKKGGGGEGMKKKTQLIALGKNVYCNGQLKTSVSQFSFATVLWDTGQKLARDREKL